MADLTVADTRTITAPELVTRFRQINALKGMNPTTKMPSDLNKAMRYNVVAGGAASRRTWHRFTTCHHP
jgi:hypothetical protein